MPIYSFSCQCGWVEDRRVGRDICYLTCPSCGQPAGKAEVYRVAFQGYTATPLTEKEYHQEFKDFTEASAELEYKHGRMEEAAGRSLQPPPLAKTGIAKAKSLMAKGVQSSDDWKSREKH